MICFFLSTFFDFFFSFLSFVDILSCEFGITLCSIRARSVRTFSMVPGKDLAIQIAQLFLVGLVPELESLGTEQSLSGFPMIV